MKGKRKVRMQYQEYLFDSGVREVEEDWGGSQ